jgi:mono/diheme cytochrome c family protein
VKHVSLALVVIIAAGNSLARYAAGGDPHTSVIPERNAAQVYGRYCISCHGRTGTAKTGRGRSTHARNLTDASWQDRVSDERIFNAIMNGKGKMPAYDKKVSEKEADALVTYVRGLRK